MVDEVFHSDRVSEIGLPHRKLQSFESYPLYRTSDIEGLREIPDHWEVRRLKYLATVNDEALTETTDPNMEIAYVDIGNVDPVAGITGREDLVFEDAPSRARRVVRQGDVIISTVRTYLRAIARIESKDANLIVSTGFAVIRPRELDDGFCAYALSASYFVERVVAHSVGVSYPAINASELACLDLVLPPLPEQRAIAAFLDRETADIDSLIAKKERLIELLQEKRAALISRAVTKGLDPDVPMKDSGVEWLGEIPAHWKVTALRRLTTQVTHPLRVDSEQVYREIGIRSWGKGIFHKDPIQGVHLGDKRVFNIRPGELVLNIVFAWEGAVAVVSECDRGMIASHRFPTFQHISTLVHLDYLLMFLQSEHGRTLMGLNSPGAAGRNRTIRIDAFLNEEVSLPPLKEQQEIVSAFRKGEQRLQSLSAKIREAINRLKELRAALISAAVTGRIDVREEAA